MFEYTTIYYSTPCQTYIKCSHIVTVQIAENFNVVHNDIKFWHPSIGIVSLHTLH